MNSIFQKNISALQVRNSSLAYKILAHIPTDIPELIQENGAYNLLYKGKLVHNKISPLGEAKEIFSMAQNTPVSIHLVYGLGLGYLFQVVSANSIGTVILYEPDLTILKIVFTLVDFSNDILKQNVYFSDNFDEVSEIVYKKSGMKNFPELLSLTSAQEFDPNGFGDFVRKLKNAIGAFSLDLRYTKEKFYPSLKMLINNIPKLMYEIPLARFKDVYQGKTALVVSAGPTLDRNIETIKKYRDRFVLFVVGTALKALETNGIKPDFLCIIETYDSSKQIAGIDLSGVNFITEPYSNPKLRDFKFKQIFSHIAANVPINHLWSEITGENIEEYWSKGTVSYTALNSARLLGCSKIILVGQDLAYIEGQCYSKDSAYKDLVCGVNPEIGRWEIMAKDFEKFADAISNNADKEKRKTAAQRRLKNLNASLYLVKGISGDMIPTESVYAAFVKPLEEYAEHFNDRTYINTSLVGAQIDGFENMSLEEALQNSEPVGDLSLINGRKYDREMVYNNIKLKSSELKEAFGLIEEGLKLYKGLNNDIKRYKSATVEVLKSLKKLSLNYMSLSSDFTKKSKLFDFMTSSERIDLDYEMKMTQEFSVENISNIADKINNYYVNAKKRIEEIEALVEGVC